MAEPLTEAQVDALKDRLTALRDELVAVVHGADERSGTVELDGAMGRLSRMDALQQQEMAMAQVRQAEKRLASVQRAIVRAQGDDYGWCPDCGEPIGFQRLVARPEAPFCLTCTQKRGG